ncbi:PAP2-domain-containing protein [Mollisia scopiformis]|uniref:PAP2-domain-containing protein n=1 Tax=Mollisia scopiformis TaxID=149040 RepID=A0A194XDV5_MOLSC|nr:PAP2-domain-containing protein [Mollisia scopiformis]KUJ18358.1 PAP2-domain-containing protein [Mollisia scopiformis]
MGAPHPSNFLSLDPVLPSIFTFLQDNGAAILFDFLCCITLSAVAAIVHFAPNYKSDNRIVPVNLGPSDQIMFPTELLYPYKEPLVSTLVRRFRDYRAATTGLVKTVLAATIVSETVKHFVGGFRPHYIEVCQPDLTLLTSVNTTTSNATWWMGPAACTGDKAKVLNALWGFPSGHSATSFASSVFMALYLNGKLKPFSDLAPGVLDLAIVLSPLLLASLVSGSQYVTHQHHAHEVLVGMLIGTVSGLCTYRARYAAIFNFRNNHIPLPAFPCTIDDQQNDQHLCQPACDEKLPTRRWWARLSEKGGNLTLGDGYPEVPRQQRRCLVW